MTKRKRQQPTIEEILERPWCYYCERDFDDLKILISHQKAKHYKCGMCSRRLNTAGGLGVHMSQVHKEALQYIENTLPNRKDATIEIFGMEGIPQAVLDAHKQRITTEYFKMVAERREQTGNPPAGTQGSGQVKKLKIETPEEIKQRLAEHRAKKQAETMGISDDRSSATPTNGASPFTAPGNDSPAVAPSPSITQNSPQPPFPAAFPGPPAAGYVSTGLSPNMPPFPPQPIYVMQPPMPMHSPSPVYPGPHQGMPSFPVMHQPRPFSHNGPTQNSTKPPVQNSPLETDVPGLPARPPVNAPQYSREDMARMHAGAPARGLPNIPPPAVQQSAPQPPTAELRESKQANAQNGSQQATNDTVLNSASADLNALDLRKSEAALEEMKAVDVTSKKTGKKSKATDTKIKMVYSDSAISPEEKRASLPRYAFQRDDATEYVLGDAGPAVTGSVRGSDDVMDTQSSH